MTPEELKQILDAANQPSPHEKRMSLVSLLIAVAAVLASAAGWAQYFDAKITAKRAVERAVKSEVNEAARTVDQADERQRELKSIAAKLRANDPDSALKRIIEAENRLKKQQEQQTSALGKVQEKATQLIQADEGFVYYEVGADGELTPYGQLVVTPDGKLPDYSTLKVGDRLLAKSRIYLREGPTTKERIVKTYNEGQVVKVLAKVRELDSVSLGSARSGGWLRVITEIESEQK